MAELFDIKTNQPPNYDEQYLVLLKTSGDEFYWDLDYWGKSYHWLYEIGEEAVFKIVWKFKTYDNVAAWAPLPDRSFYINNDDEDLLDES